MDGIIRLVVGSILVYHIFSNTEFHTSIMDPTTILSVSERGQITIPMELRRQLGSKHLICTLENNSVVLRPLQTKEDFIKELEDAKKSWKKDGGLTLAQMKKKYSL